MPYTSVVPNERRYDVDWLRVFATYLLFPFHVGKVFDVPPYYPIKSPDLSWSLAYFTTFIHQWHMPLFFLLAGWSFHASIERRGMKGALSERIERILVPFLVGTATLCVVITYFERVLMTGRNMTFLQFVPKFFTSLDYFSWSHLWFLAYLFTFTFLWIPIFRRLTANADTWTLRHSWYIYRPIPALFLMQGILRIWWPGYQNLYNDWGNFSYYSIAMMLGFLLGCQPALGTAIDREWRRAAVAGLAASALLLWTNSHREWPDAVRHINYYLFGTIAGYTLNIALLGFARQYLNFRNRALDYLAESALPVYVLHQAGIVVPGWFIIHLKWSMPARVALLLGASVLVTMAVYHFLVRPFAVPRRLLGMKQRRRRPRPQVWHVPS